VCGRGVAVDPPAGALISRGAPLGPQPEQADCT